MSQYSFRHAVVVGASMAGLMAARVLSEHFDRVTLIEKDTLPRGPEARRGVPQGNHIHVLMLGGQMAMERLFPGLAGELQAAGAVSVNGGSGIAWFHDEDWRTRRDSDLRVLAMSRPLLESRVAERVRALPNVTLREGVRVQGLVLEPGGLVGGLRVQGLGREILDADLVVDAGGRGSSMPEWLRQMGYPEVPMEHIPMQISYATCVFPRPEGGPDWQALLVSDGKGQRNGFLFPMEGDRWIVTMTTFFDGAPPADHEEFLAFARSLPVPDLHEAIRDLDPLSEVVRYRHPGSQRRRYERAAMLPGRLLVMGDALSSFNPVFGQGMTVAALEAEALGRWLEAAREEGMTARMQARWFREAGAIADAAWQGVALEDYRRPELAGEAPLSMRPLQWYMARVHRATYRSPAVTDLFYRIINFLEPPTALFRPRIMAEVLFGGRPRPQAAPVLEASRQGG